jgi:uncharacterized membrane protein
MTLTVGILAITVFLSGAVAGVLAMLVIGIRRGDRAHRLTDQPGTQIDALARRMLGVGVRTDCPAGNGHSEGA